MTVRNQSESLSAFIGIRNQEGTASLRYLAQADVHSIAPSASQRNTPSYAANMGAHTAPDLFGPVDENAIRRHRN
jgi:hypothetical protein